MAIKTKNGKVLLKNGKASCACCGTCGCEKSSVNAILKGVLDNATSGTADGSSNSFWYVSGPDVWFALWLIPLDFGYLTTGTIECPPPFGDDYTYEEKTYTLNGFSFPCVSAMQKNPPSPEAPFPPPTFIFA